MLELQACTTISSFYVGAGDPNSGSHDYAVSTLPTVPTYLFIAILCHCVFVKVSKHMCDDAKIDAVCCREEDRNRENGDIRTWTYGVGRWLSFLGAKVKREIGVMCLCYPQEKNGIETPRRMGFSRKKGCWGQGHGSFSPALLTTLIA